MNSKTTPTRRNRVLLAVATAVLAALAALTLVAGSGEAFWFHGDGDASCAKAPAAARHTTRQSVMLPRFCETRFLNISFKEIVSNPETIRK